jgi:hypothetical protein
VRAGIVIDAGLTATGPAALTTLLCALVAPTSFIWPAAHKPGIIEVIEDAAIPVTDDIYYTD